MIKNYEVQKIDKLIISNKKVFKILKIIRSLFSKIQISYKLLPQLYSHNFASDSRDELTANDNSTGSSGGITDVKIRIHSKNNLYLLRFGSSVPAHEKIHSNVNTLNGEVTQLRSRGTNK